MAGGKATKTVVLDGKSPIRAAVLAVLLEAPGHGWDVALRVNRRMGSSWRVRGKHIYPVLKQLEVSGLVRSVAETSSQPPFQRTVYHPTDTAAQARAEWLAMPPATNIVRTDLQARLAFSSEEDIPVLLRALGERRTDILEEIEENTASEPPRISWLGTVMGLQRSAVDKRLKAEMDWIEEAIRELEGLRGKRAR